MIDYDYRLDYISSNSYFSLIFPSTDTKIRLEADLPLKAVELKQSETGFYIGEIKDSPTMRFIKFSNRIPLCFSIGECSTQ